MPQVDGGIGDGVAGGFVDDDQAQPQWNAGLVFGDIGADEFARDVERANLLLGGEGAGFTGYEAEGAWSDVQGGGSSEGLREKTAARELNSGLLWRMGRTTVDGDVPLPIQSVSGLFAS